MTSPVLELIQITKRFGPLLANDAITLSLAQGEVLALLGENGAGKTTLMNILFGHYTADAGEVRVHGRPLPPGKPRAAIESGVGMVHQHFMLVEPFTVLENVILGAEGEAVLSIRVQMPEVWDLVRFEVPPTTAVRELKLRALQELYPDWERPEEFVVKLNGFEVLDEGQSVVEAGARDGSTFLLTGRKRRPVR